MLTVRSDAVSKDAFMITIALLTMMIRHVPIAIILHDIMHNTSENDGDWHNVL